MADYAHTPVLQALMRISSIHARKGRHEQQQDSQDLRPDNCSRK
jgi:hypothetical protein